MKPLTYKLQFREDENDHDFHDRYWDTGLGAAGCIFIAKDTARLLIAHRSRMVNEPGTWGTWGGKIDEDETIVQAITREVEEETGYDGNYKINHLWTFEDHDEGFQYHNYLVLVPNEFTPKLNWENEGSKWVEWGEWPSPMHFGLKALLQNAGDKLFKIIRLLKRKQADILDETMTTVPAQPPAIVQKASAASAAVPVNITNAYVIAATLWGEARGEGQNGMQAVLNVLMNRADGNFHKVAKIALSPKQFSMWNSVTNPADAALHMARRNQKDRQWNQAVQLVDQAMHGHLPDITGGAQFYFNPKKAQPSWAKEMVPTTTIGHHEFFRPATPEDKKKKKVPSAITEMIQNQNPHDTVVFKKGIVSDGVWEYEMRSPFSFILYKFAPKIKLFYFDLIGTPNAGDQNQGHAKAILETFFQMVKQYKGALDCDTYSTSGMYKIKPAIEKLAKKYGVRIIKGREDLMMESYGGPGDHVVFGGVWSTGNVVAKVVTDKQGSPGHTMDMGRIRWTYYQNSKTVFWNSPPDDKQKRIVQKWLTNKGYAVDGHRLMDDMWQFMYSLHKRRDPNEPIAEGERTDYLDQTINKLEAEWDRLDGQGIGFDRQQQIRKELAALQKERANWAKVYNAVDKAQNQGFATVKKQRKVSVPQVSV